MMGSEAKSRRRGGRRRAWNLLIALVFVLAGPALWGVGCEKNGGEKSSEEELDDDFEEIDMEEFEEAFDEIESGDGDWEEWADEEEAADEEESVDEEKPADEEESAQEEESADEQASAEEEEE